MNTEEISCAREADRLTGALIGLVRVCNHKKRTAESDRLLLEGLTLSAEVPAGIGEAAALAVHLREMTEAVHREKNVISPGCAECASPCGGTVDYNMKRYREEPDENIRSLKTLILFTARTLASMLWKSGRTEDGTAPEGNHEVKESNVSERPGDSAEFSEDREDTLIYLCRCLMTVGDDYSMEDDLRLLMEAAGQYEKCRPKW